MPLTELPFGFPGRIFRSPMPFGQYDLHGEVYDRFCEEQIAVIVLLASDEELSLSRLSMQMHTGPRESWMTAEALEASVSLGVGGPGSLNRDNLKWCAAPTADHHANRRPEDGGAAL